MGANGMNLDRSHLQPTLSDDRILKSNPGCVTSLEKRNEAEVTANSEISLGKTRNHHKQHQSCASIVNIDLRRQKSSSHDIEKKSNVFDGRLFCFSGSFPADQVNCCMHISYSAKHLILRVFITHILFALQKFHDTKSILSA